MDVMRWYRAERWLYLHHMAQPAMLIKGAIRILWGGVIPFQADIGEGTVIGYQGIGVVIHKQAVIGKNCSIGQNVTIGGGGRVPGVPTIGNDVHIGSGAVVIGGIHIGDNVHIGANAVVNSDIPANCVAVGAPAKPVKFLSGA